MNCYIKKFLKISAILLLSINNSSFGMQKQSSVPHHTGNKIIREISKLQQFSYEGLDFILVRDEEQDADQLAQVYMDPGAISLFGQTLNYPTALQIAQGDIKKNKEFLEVDSRKIPDVLTWVIEKERKVIGVINVEVLGYGDGEITQFKDAQAKPHTEQEKLTLLKQNIRKKGAFNMSRIMKQGKTGGGAGTLACKALVNQMFKFTNAELVISYSLEENKASQRSAEKCGLVFQFDFITKDKMKKLYIIEKK